MSFSKAFARHRASQPAWAVLLLVAFTAGVSAAPAVRGGQDNPGVSLTVDGISASVGEDNPRVLYILPWQAPSLPRRPREDLEDKVPSLVESVDPDTVERHRVFRKTLNPLVLSPDRDAAMMTQ